MRLSDYSQSGGRGLFRRDRRLFDQRGTFTFTIPDGVTKVWAFSMGAGGGATVNGMDGSLTQGMLGGGKGGGYASGIISGLTPGNTLTLTVGSGGVGEHDSAGTSATAGGNSTVVGGSTTYLQGNGGGAGAQNVTSDPGDQKGQGGSASTNSVTDAYTAAGGGSGNWHVVQEVNNTGSAYIVTGGGASGSPFGTGMGGGKSVGLQKAATGGGGWTQRDFEHSKWVIDNADLSTEVGNMNGFALGLPGYGSHTAPQFFYMGAPYKFRTTVRGGNGRTAKGKSAIRPSTWGGEYTDTGTAYSNNNYATDALLNFHSYLDGEDGNPHWWFPWEIDGGGGAGITPTSSESNDANSTRMWVGGNGGPGAGGGGIFVSGIHSNVGSDSEAVLIGGNGGFGAGGGGSYTEIQDSNQPDDHSAVGGNGGNGGGGGGAKGYGNNNSVGGNGGDGCIGIYW